MGRGRPKIPEKSLLNAIRKTAGNDPPTQKQMDEEGPYSSQTYINRFGSWISALQEAGYIKSRSIGEPWNKGNRKHEQPRITLRTGKRGWEYFRYTEPGNIHWNDGVDINHHRLLADLWLDEDIDGKVIHHKSGIPWDNREDNLEVLTAQEHGRISSIEYHQG